MDTILKALKKAENEAEEIEKSAKDNAANIIKKAEAESRKLEAEANSMAKAAGESLVKVRMDAAKLDADNIREGGKKKATELEKIALGNFDACVNEVVGSAIRMIKEAGKES